MLQAQRKALLDLWIALENSKKGTTGHLGDLSTCDRCDTHWAPIAKQIKPTRKVITTLAIGHNALVTVGTLTSPVFAQGIQPRTPETLVIAGQHTTIPLLTLTQAMDLTSLSTPTGS